MSDQPQAGRRQALKFLAGAPLLPLGAFSTASLLSACGGSSSAAVPATVTPVAANFIGAEFTAMPAPSLANAAAMATTTVGSTLSVNFSDNSSQTYKLAYQPFFLTGDSHRYQRQGSIRCCTV